MNISNSKGKVNYQRIEPNSETESSKIDSSYQIKKMQPRTLSEVFVLLLGSHKEFVLEDLRKGRPFGHEGEFEVVDDLIDNFMFFYKSDDSHLLHMWTERIDLSPCHYLSPEMLKSPTFAYGY